MNKFNKHTITAMILYYGVLDVLKQDLIEYTQEEKIKLNEIRDILKNEVLRDEVVNSQETITALQDFKKFYDDRKKEETYWDKLMIKLPDIFNEGDKKK